MRNSLDKNIIQIDLESVLRLCGADNLTIEEYRNKSELAQAEFIKTVKEFLKKPDVSVIIARHPCIFVAKK